MTRRRDRVFGAVGSFGRRVVRLIYKVAGRVVPPLRHLDLFRRGLRDSGWTESHRRQQSVDAEGRPLPWITYGAIHFLEGRVRDTMRVFEYGAGNSTRWWAGKTPHVTSVEHDADWVAQLTDLPDSVVLLERRLDDRYVEAIRGRGPFEIVIIDGRNRVACTYESLTELSDDGIVVFDNTDRPQYQDAYDRLSSEGFRRLDFHGLGPINNSFWTTSVFYRDANCLGL